MSTETIARRYGTALADVVTASGETTGVRDELRQWQEIFAANADLGTVFSNPAITHANKAKVLEGLISRTQPAKTTANFLRILLENGRLSDLADINDRFGVVLEERSGLVSASITTARELPEEERAAFQANLNKLTGRTVKIDFDVDREIIGGVVTRIGSTVYDGSVRSQLENLKEQLING
jgi:F-type H+-transporting ATPase subunit delta